MSSNDCRMVKSAALHMDPASSNVSISDTESLNTVECEQLLNSHDSRYNITGGISRFGLEVSCASVARSMLTNFLALHRDRQKENHDSSFEQ